MIFIFVLAAIAMLYANIKDLPSGDRRKVWLFVFVYLILMGYYTNFINQQPTSFGYGIPQADMLAHYRGAEAISRGYSWSELSTVATRFEEVGLNTVGYFIYTSFLYVCLFVLPVFDVGTNIYLVYVFQILLSVDTCVRYNRFFRRCIPEVRSNTGLYILICCVPFVVQACQLMRDIYYMWMIALLFEAIQKGQYIKNHVSVNQQIRIPSLNGLELILRWLRRNWLLLLAMTMCVLLRFYSVIVFLPPALYYSNRKKLGVMTSFCISAALLLGVSVINILREQLGIPWTFASPDLGESIQFFLFPNIINQSKYLFNWQFYFGDTIDISGCNVPGVYYAMSVWNIWAIPLMFIGFAAKFRKYKWEHLMWGTILLNTVLTYSMVYPSIDTRHKFFMAIPMCFLALRGITWLKQKGRILFYSYNLAVYFLVSILLIVAW